MRKLFYCLMLVTSITGTAYAQDGSNNASDRTFEQNPNYFSRGFTIDLGMGNKMQIELRNIADLDRLSNADSILRVFLTDIQALKDSLTDELTSKRIDYITDTAGRKKIRIQQFKPKGSSFVVDQGDLAALKLEQDTVHIRNTFNAKYTLKRGSSELRHYRMSFFVNNLSDLNSLPDGILNGKIKLLKENLNGQWVKGGGKVYLSADRSISWGQANGYYSHRGFHWSLSIAMNLQNYKNYFVPSCNLGAVFLVSSAFFKHEIGLFWEPNFFFAKNTEGNLRTFRNDFVTVTLGHGFVRDRDPRKESNLLAIFSYGYLVNRQGNYFTKHTSRLGAGRLSLFNGKMRIEPAIYFNDFFKGVTPAVRLMRGI